MENQDQIILNNLREHRDLIASLEEESYSQIKICSKIISNSLMNGGTIYWYGNGGSAADSQHFASELVGRFIGPRKPLRSVALTTDSSVITSIANDFSYKEIFSRQIDALAKKDDVLVSISTSGESKNIIQAINVAKNLGLKTISLLGKDGGLALKLSEQSILIPSSKTARIQEMHLLVGHILCELIEKELGLA